MVLDETDILNFCPSNSAALTFYLGRLATSYFQDTSSSSLIIVPDERIMTLVVNDLRFFFSQESASSKGSKKPPDVLGFPALDVLPFDGLSPAPQVSADRCAALCCLVQSQEFMLVTTPAAMMQRIISPQSFESLLYRISVGMEVDREELITILDSLGYQRNSLVEEIGQVAVRGAVVDFFPPSSKHPLRVELFGRCIDSLRLFDPSSQRSLAEIEEFVIAPVREWFVPQQSDCKTPFTFAEIIGRMRLRASELVIPQVTLKPIEDALENGIHWAGLEHLQPFFKQDLVSLLSYLSPESQVVLSLPEKIRQNALLFDDLVNERAEVAIKEGRIFPPSDEAYISSEKLYQQLELFSTIELEADSYLIPNVVLADSRKISSLSLYTQNGVVSNSRLTTDLRAAKHRERPFRPLAEEIQQRLNQGFSVLISVSIAQRSKRVMELLQGYDIESNLFSGEFSEWLDLIRSERLSKGVYVICNQVSSGFTAPFDRFQLITEQEIFPEISVRPKSTAAKSIRRFIGLASQLQENDYAVHIDYGIALYRGLKTLSVDGRLGDFLELEYAEQAKLYVPVESIAKVQKYCSGGGQQVTLSRLGTKVWENTKRKVRENVAELAGQLLDIMAKRSLAERTSYGPFDAADREFADGFPFEETADQEAAISAVLTDLSKAQPMDRLVCGDVGYGKTEVALRAAFKVANNGRQVAILVPTTILAEQHFSSFRERFLDSAIRVACISRFYNAQQNKETLAELAQGRVDIIIGTHRLLQKDVSFKNLGLVIIDEEHRFGVAHKEKLKRIRSEVDVLTLTATPIPRTLQLSLTGIRDLSLIETPPCNRQMIRTHLGIYEESIVREAILRELGRSGQIFYIHNRVQDIVEQLASLSALVPEAKIAVAHGQMAEKELEQVMHRFINQEVDILLATTIVESGLDIPNANTIIINHAERFGLAELYQLRGRVGRSSRRAFAYLLISDQSKLKDDAKKRLEVLQSLDDLGVGFRLALQDMEIRGAGNLLGKDQSGHVNVVGYELYSQILRDAVNELKKRQNKRENTPWEPFQLNLDPEIRIGFPAYIPPDYVPDVGERLILYQRLIEIKDQLEGEEFAMEMGDRFGQMPNDVEILIELMVLRSLFKRSGILSANLRGDVLSIKFHHDVIIEPQKVLNLVSAAPGKYRISPAMVFSILLDQSPITTPSEVSKEVELLLKRLEIYPTAWAVSRA